MVEKKVLAETFIGIGYLFIINEIVTIIAYFLSKRYIDPEAGLTPTVEISK